MKSSFQHVTPFPTADPHFINQWDTQYLVKQKKSNFLSRFFLTVVIHAKICFAVI